MSHDELKAPLRLKSKSARKPLNQRNCIICINVEIPFRFDPYKENILVCSTSEMKTLIISILLFIIFQEQSKRC